MILDLQHSLVSIFSLINNELNINYVVILLMVITTITLLLINKKRV